MKFGQRDISTALVFNCLCIFLMASCRGSGVGLTESGIQEGVTGFDAQIQPIFDTNCIRCHAPGGLGFNQTGGSQNNGLDLTKGKSYGSLVNQPTFQLPNTAPNHRVTPRDPDASYIIQKISSASPKFGRRMPFDGPPYLSQSDIQLIRNWIAAGAPNN
ncbi:MAG: c-type cytochrome [bacterium]